MNQQEQIAHLAAALEEVGKMPEWIAISPSSGVHYKYNAVPKMDGSWQQGQTLLRNDSFALVALCGVAAEYVASHPKGGGVTKSAGGFIAHIGGTHKCGIATFTEALAAAVRIAGKGERQ